ncbi:carboxyl transferase domain-containing protein [Saccharopolyspora sp. TS4A08]|uniref:acetyl-CoA carboxylase n=1 Tax=Saccharopolyspora ipomoeae TaxID=3042027 RepID=A0ABT6PI97_9PSEU|nr:carboxyl transferase domain-containing protein [Saccharopolyspora sp. TS4A08]MDI2027723.1 carboxyl transferase domain-containing protein [Saccharopolyspora sp. TS4A08]
MKKLLIANRGEIALRVVRTAREMRVSTVALYAEDDADTPHVHAADEALPLAGVGPAAYLDHAAVLAAAARSGADVVHPGYGFLSENAEFARACATAGLGFAGPDPAVLETLGDKASARAAAVAVGVPVLPATTGGATADEVRAFFAENPGGIMIKALAGGGGRGMRVVRGLAAVDEAHRACADEAELGFGNREVFAEALFDDARHVEVQVVGDGAAALALGDRDCSVQRRHQKLLEIAPAELAPDVRRGLHESAVRLCASLGYRGLATVEFLVRGQDFAFLEVNPRIQVEHTITEEVTGVDLVAAQLALADGSALRDLALPGGVVAEADDVRGEPVSTASTAVQARVNLETMTPDGDAVPTAGTLTTFTPPTGPGVRVDTFGLPGLVVSPRYDSLLAKVIVRAGTRNAALAKLETSLGEFAIEGAATNIPFLRALLADDDLRAGPVSTAFLAGRVQRLVAEAGATAPTTSSSAPALELRQGEEVVRAQMAGTVVAVAAEGDEVPAGGQLIVLEAMKMEHVLAVDHAARVVRALVSPGRTVAPGDPLVVHAPTRAVAADSAFELDLDASRPDLDELRERQARTRDSARPEAVAKRHRIGRRTARENIADLVDPGSFVEYGALAIAAQRRRRSEQDLITNTPADGLVGGVATIGADRFGRGAAEVVVMSYDYAVLAGTQGMRNHAKTDRILGVARDRKTPVVLFAEGGGGRPGDTDVDVVAGLDVPTFRLLGSLRGGAPTVAIVSGRCFAGNAALAGACDVVIATPDANIGMGGPAMISGGGLGEYRPEEIGPIEVQRRNGVVDLVAADEEHAVQLARRYLSYFQSPLTPGDGVEWEAPDPRLARHAVPENRLRAYDIRSAIDAIADVGSVLELRADHGVGVVTALVRVEGVAYGLVANSSHHLGGAIDAEAAGKLGEFLELCDSGGLSIVSLCDTPGFMVGPEAEKDATVKRFGELFVIGARLSVPFGAVVLRKGYGLGAMAMTGGSFKAPQFTVAWPTGEIGGMGLEGAVRLGYSKELAAAPDEAARRQLYDQLVAESYERGRALSAATTFELDDVIDPADTRRWISTLRPRRDGGT